MRIAYLLNSRVPSDHAHVIQTLQMCNAFAAAGHDVTLFHPARAEREGSPEGTPLSTYYDIPVNFSREAVPYVDANSVIKRVLGRSRPQFVASRGTFTLQIPFRLRAAGFDLHYTRGTFVAMALVAAGLPTVLEIHRADFGRLEQFLLSRVGRRGALRAVVTLTERGKRELSAVGLPAGKIQVHPDAVSLERYESAHVASKPDLDGSWPSDRPLVAYTGSFEAGKGVYDLVDACGPLEVTLALVGGDVDEREAMTDYLEAEGIENVRLVGRVPPADVPAYQQAADVLALAPTEGVENARHHPAFTSPLKLFEYMAAGRPIVATSLPGIEAVIEDGETGLLVPPGDVNALRDAIDRVTSDPDFAAALGERAREAVEAYTWSRRAADILEEL